MNIEELKLIIVYLKLKIKGMWEMPIFYLIF